MIASALPLLLQLALLLFFVGLSLFFHQLDAVVAWFTTGTAILWLGSFLFATLAPTFSSQCPYKTPFLKGAISHLRVKLVSMSWPEDLSRWLWRKTPEDLFPSLDNWFWKAYTEFQDRRKTWESLEEGVVCKDGSLSLPVISYARDLLQGERLRDSIEDCIRGISHEDINKAEEEIRLQSSRMHHALPYISEGLARNVESLLFEVVQNIHIQPTSFRHEICSRLYPALTRLQSKAYAPGPDNYVIPFRLLPSFIRLIQVDPASAAFPLLTMYSIRHHTLTDHPNSFNHLFDWLSESERHRHGIGKLISFSPSLFQLTKSQMTDFYQTCSKQQKPSYIPSGLGRETSSMEEILANVSKRSVQTRIHPMPSARRIRSLLSPSLLVCCIAWYLGALLRDAKPRFTK